MKTVLAGIDNLESVDSVLKDRRVGLITGPTGLNRQFQSTVDVLNAHCNLVRLFAPEHGVRGDRQAGEDIESYVDEETGLEVVSLYGSGRENDALISGIDVLVVDIQDVGARFYTYLYTMTGAMKSCAKAGIPMVILDRMNPLGLEQVEGSLLDERFSSFVGKYAVPTRYGLTMGEFARYINAVKGFGTELYVAKCVGLDRTTRFEDTDGIWVAPSPNIPTLETAVCYIGTALFEGTNVSEGRGTTHPFEMIGAPWLDNRKLVRELSGHDLPGVRFRECYFTPVFSKYTGQVCRGVQVHVTDPRAFQAFKTGLLMVDTIRKISPEFAFREPAGEGRHYFIDLLFGSDALRRPDFEPYAFIEKENAKIMAFKQESSAYYLY